MDEFLMDPYVIYLPIFFKVASLALGQSQGCSSEVLVKDMGNVN